MAATRFASALGKLNGKVAGGEKGVRCVRGIDEEGADAKCGDSRGAFLGFEEGEAHVE